MSDQLFNPILCGSAEFANFGVSVGDPYDYNPGYCDQVSQTKQNPDSQSRKSSEKVKDVAESSPLKSPVQASSSDLSSKKVSASPPSSSQKVDDAAKKKSRIPLACVGIMLWSALNCLLLWVPITRAVSYVRSKTLRDDVEKCQADALVSVLKIDMSAEKLGEIKDDSNRPEKKVWVDNLVNRFGVEKDPKTIQEAEDLVSKALKIWDKIDRLKKGESVPGGVEGIKRDLAACTDLEFYRSRKTWNAEVINFLQILAIKCNCGDARSALKEYGQKVLGDKLESIQGDAVSPEEFTNAMFEYFEEPSFKTDGAWWALYAAAHPFNAIDGSFTSNFDPLKYDTLFNPVFLGHVFQRDEKEVHFCYGPTPTGNSLFPHGALEGNRKLGIGEARIILQDMIKGPESHRIREAVETHKQHEDVLDQAVLGFDTKMHNFPHMNDWESPEDFFSKYSEYIHKGQDGSYGRTELAPAIIENGTPQHKKDNGFHIPESTLSDEQLDTALAGAKVFCEKMIEANQRSLDLATPKDKEEMAKMMQVVADIYISLAILENTFDKQSSENIENRDPDLKVSRLFSHCKEDIDRGPVEDILLILFFEFAKSDTGRIDKKLAYQLAGALAGRSRLVADRNMLKKRFLILHGLLKMIGPSFSGQAAKCLQDYLVSYRNLNKSPDVSKESDPEVPHTGVGA